MSQQLDSTSVSERLYNEDLAPAKERHWNAWHLFCMWMSDVHSIGGYTFAAGLFFLGLTAWQVMVALIAGIFIVFGFMNLSGMMGQKLGVPYPVMSRVSFGLFGANLPALLRGIIAIFWYGIQTYLASVAIVVLLLAIFPGVRPLTQNSFFGQSTLGWIAFMFLWVVQLLILQQGMETVRRYQDFAGPAVYLIMFALVIWMVTQAGGRLNLDLSATKLATGGDAVVKFLTAVSLVVAYFSTLLLNVADFTRFAPSPRSVRWGNFWGLPVNFTAFTIVSVLTTAGTIAVFGQAITDPVEIVGRIPNVFVLALGAITFMVATIGINIVANFVSPAYDLANVAPKYINFQRGGAIAAVLAIFVQPWSIYNNPVAINYFLGGLAAFLGPLFGIIMVDYYLIRRQHVDVDALYIEGPASPYWYQGGVNRKAVYAFAIGAVISAIIALVPTFGTLAPFSWFIGVAVSGVAYWLIAGGERARWAETVTEGGQAIAEDAAVEPEEKPGAAA